MTAYTLPHLPWLRAYESAARYGSFSAAAQELHVSPAAVSLQIRSLEQHLGFALFERLPRGVRLTEMGSAYLPSVRKAFDTLSMSTAGLFGNPGERTLTVRCTAAFAVLWLAPRLQAFRAAHPGIDLRLFTAIWADGLGAGEADVEIRFGDGHWPGFEAERLHTEPSIAVCSPVWLQRASASVPLLALARKHPIHILGCEDLWTRWFRSAGSAGGEPVARGIQVDTSLTALALAASGAGFAIVLRSFAQADLQSGRLVTPFDGALVIDDTHYLLLPEGRKRPRPEVLMFCAWLRAQAGSAVTNSVDNR